MRTLCPEEQPGGKNEKEMVSAKYSSSLDIDKKDKQCISGLDSDAKVPMVSRKEVESQEAAATDIDSEEGVSSSSTSRSTCLDDSECV